jgi:hypothetical protein
MHGISKNSCFCKHIRYIVEYGVKLPLNKITICKSVWIAMELCSSQCQAVLTFFVRTVRSGFLKDFGFFLLEDFFEEDYIYWVWFSLFWEPPVPIPRQAFKESIQFVRENVSNVVITHGQFLRLPKIKEPAIFTFQVSRFSLPMKEMKTAGSQSSNLNSKGQTFIPVLGDYQVWHIRIDIRSVFWLYK